MRKASASGAGRARVPRPERASARLRGIRPMIGPPSTYSINRGSRTRRSRRSSATARARPRARPTIAPITVFWTGFGEKASAGGSARSIWRTPIGAMLATDSASSRSWSAAASSSEPNPGGSAARASLSTARCSAIRLRESSCRSEMYSWAQTLATRAARSGSESVIVILANEDCSPSAVTSIEPVNGSWRWSLTRSFTARSSMSSRFAATSRAADSEASSGASESGAVKSSVVDAS